MLLTNTHGESSWDGPPARHPLPRGPSMQPPYQAKCQPPPFPPSPSSARPERACCAWRTYSSAHMRALPDTTKPADSRTASGQTTLPPVCGACPSGAMQATHRSSCAHKPAAGRALPRGACGPAPPHPSTHTRYTMHAHARGTGVREVNSHPPPWRTPNASSWHPLGGAPAQSPTAPPPPTTTATPTYPSCGCGCGACRPPNATPTSLYVIPEYKIASKLGCSLPRPSTSTGPSADAAVHSLLSAARHLGGRVGGWWVPAHLTHTARSRRPAPQRQPAHSAPSLWALARARPFHGCGALLLLLPPVTGPCKSAPGLAPGACCEK